jgi:hypothetical protein
MPAKRKQKRFTTAQIEEHIRSIQKAIEKHKRENKGEHFTSITPKVTAKKLKRVNSPLIISQGWSNTAAGATFTYTVGIYNPDPTEIDWLFAHVWIGMGNVDSAIGKSLSYVDTRFGRLTEPAPFGLTLAAGESVILNFAIRVPTEVEKTGHIGNSYVMQLNWPGVWRYFDSEAFVFAVD